MVINLEESPSNMECNDVYRQGYGDARSAALASLPATLKGASDECRSEQLVSDFLAHLIHCYDTSWGKKKSECGLGLRKIETQLASLETDETPIKGALEGSAPETAPDESSVTSRDRAYYRRLAILKRRKSLAEIEKKRQELQSQAFDLIEKAEAYEANLKMNLQAYLYPYIQGIAAVDQRLTKSVVPASVGTLAIECNSGMAISLAQEYPSIFEDALRAWSKTASEALGGH